MHCPNCDRFVTPGLEVELAGARVQHCPYCLADLRSRDSGDQIGSALAGHAEAHDSQRATHRREHRNQFVDRLRADARDGDLYCPVCSRELNTNDEQLMRDRDHFRCHRCGYDLAYLAYHRHAFDPSNWQPVLGMLADLQQESRCEGCQYLGAIAKASECAVSRGAHAPSGRHRLLRTVLARNEWEQPECVWDKDCELVEVYRSTAGQALQLL